MHGPVDPCLVAVLASVVEYNTGVGAVQERKKIKCIRRISAPQNHKVNIYIYLVFNSPIYPDTIYIQF